MTLLQFWAFYMFMAACTTFAAVVVCDISSPHPYVFKIITVTLLGAIWPITLCVAAIVKLLVF